MQCRTVAPVPQTLSGAGATGVLRPGDPTVARRSVGRYPIGTRPSLRPLEAPDATPQQLRPRQLAAFLLFLLHLAHRLPIQPPALQIPVFVPLLTPEEMTNVGMSNECRSPNVEAGELRGAFQERQGALPPRRSPVWRHLARVSWMTHLLPLVQSLYAPSPPACPSLRGPSSPIAFVIELSGFFRHSVIGPSSFPYPGICALILKPAR